MPGEFFQIPLDALGDVVAGGRGLAQHAAIRGIHQAHEVLFAGGLARLSVVAAEIEAQRFRQGKSRGGHGPGERFATRKAGDDGRLGVVGRFARLQRPRAAALAAAGPRRPALAGEELGRERGGPFAEDGPGLRAAFIQRAHDVRDERGLGREVVAELAAGERGHVFQPLHGHAARQAGELAGEVGGGDVHFVEQREPQERGLFAGDGEHDIEHGLQVGLGEPIQRELGGDVRRA